MDKVLSWNSTVHADDEGDGWVKVNVAWPNLGFRRMSGLASNIGGVKLHNYNRLLGYIVVKYGNKEH